MIKKILKIVLVSLFVLMGVALAVPYLFKSRIIAKVKKEINAKLNAKVDFKDVNISFLRHFPKVAVGLDELYITGNGIFANDTLLAAKQIDAAVNIMSVITGSDITIYSVFVNSPRIHAIVTKDSQVNWNIVKPDTIAATTGAKKPFKMELQNYAITNAYINYKDETAAIGTEIFNLNHSGSGDFTEDIFTLKTSTTAQNVNVSYGGIAYLSNATVAAVADIQVDNKNIIYRFNTDKIMVNELQLASQGSIKSLLKKGYDLDIVFKAPSTAFKNILSLVPAVYRNDFDKIKTTGTAIFSGFVKGIYNETTMPAYHVDVEVKDGFFKYPDLPKPLQNINIKVQVNNPDGITDNTIINVEKAHFELDNEPFEIRLLIKNPITNLYVDAAAKGKLNLDKVAQLVKLQAGTKISGLLNADIFVKGTVKAIEAQKPAEFTAGGTLNLNNFLYNAKDYPTRIKISNLQTSFTPAKVDITNMSGQYLESNFNGSGQINNLLNYMLQSKPLNAVINLRADNINLNNWMAISTDTVAARGPAAAPFAVPANLNVLVNTQVDKVHYDKLDITNLTGSLKVNDETVTMADVKGNALDGSIIINGTYSTKASKATPTISLMYTVDKVDVQKTFNAFNTVQAIMPIGKFIAGKLTSQLTINGKLGDNMMPDLKSLTGNGNLLLIEGFLSKFAPLEKIATTLNVKALEQISIKDVKNYIEFSNGQVLVKPFALKIKDIDMEIGGLQGFNQSIDYVINIKLPRALMGDKGNLLVNNLVSQVNSKGVPLIVSDIINLNLKLGGFITKPTLKTDLKQGVENIADQLKAQVVGFAKAKIDSTKKALTSAVKDTIASVKKQAIDAAKDALIKQIAGNKTDSTGSGKPVVKPVETVKGLLNNLFKQKKDTTKKQ